MAYRCVANLLGAWSHDAACAAAHADAFKQIVAPHISKILDAISAPISDGVTTVRLAACTVLLNTTALLKGGFAASNTWLDADAAQMQCVSLCAHALGSVEAMTQPSEAEALYRVLTAFSTTLEVDSSAVELSRDLDMEAALRSLKLADGAPPKLAERVNALTSTLGAKRAKQ
mmetsp:Transcript_35616/g.74806  ORF Transcript_35616/g.74806 Transcript_35616/m.74806 type:complete len:173 (-) Transcript_35616:283-801(-)